MQFFRVVKSLMLTLFMMPQHAVGLPEAALKERWPKVESYFASQVKTGDFTGSGGAKKISYAYVEGDPRLPPVSVSVGLG